LTQINACERRVRQAVSEKNRRYGMQGTSTLKRHADLVDRMANTQGVDLEERMMAGKILPDDLSDAVLACTGCANPEACEHWLARNETAEQTPGYCRNADLFARLKLGRRA
jgi:hypothetical protein